MAFPTVHLADSFKRATESPLSNKSQWQAIFGMAHTGLVSSEHYRSADTFATQDGAYWSNATYAEPSCVLTYEGAGSAERYARLFAALSSPGTAALSGYTVKVLYESATKVKLLLEKITANVYSGLAEKAAVTVAVGDKYGLTVGGGKVKVWLKKGAGEWEVLLEVADASYTEGYVGLGATGNTHSYNNFEIGGVAHVTLTATQGSTPTLGKNVNAARSVTQGQAVALQRGHTLSATQGQAALLIYPRILEVGQGQHAVLLTPEEEREGYEPEWLGPVGNPRDPMLHPALVPTQIYWWARSGRGEVGQAGIVAGKPEPINAHWLKTTLFIAGPSPQPTVIAGEYLYILVKSALTTGSYSIARVSLATGETDYEWFVIGPATPLNAPQCLASDGEYLYISYVEGPFAFEHGGISRLKLDDQTYELKWLEGLGLGGGGAFAFEPAPFQAALAVGGGYIYWQVGQGIARARIDGTEIIEPWIRHVELARIGSLALSADGEYIWFGKSRAVESKYVHFAGRVKLDGSVIEEVIGLRGSDMQIALDSEYLYWTWTVTNYIGRWKLEDITFRPIVTKEEKKEEEKKEEEEGAGGKKEKEEEEAEKEKEKEKEVEGEREAKEEEEIKQKEHEEKEVTEEEEEREKEAGEEGGGSEEGPGGGIIEPPGEIAGAVPTTGVVRFGRPT